MSRSPHITAAGYRRLQDELSLLWSRRAGVTRALAAAAAEGDRSENAEYIYRKKELREIDRRIRYLQKRLPLLKVVGQRPSVQSRVYFGALITLKNEDGVELRCRIVGTDELDPESGHISIDSPLARATLGKGLDDEVEVMTPAGRRRYLLTGLEYPDMPIVAPASREPAGSAAAVPPVRSENKPGYRESENQATASGKPADSK